MSNLDYSYDIKCCYCGKFIAFKDFDNGKAKRHFKPDTAYNGEEQWDWHVTCEKKESK